MSTSDKSAIVEVPDQDMEAVAKDFFFQGMILPVPIFIRLKEATYLTIVKQGDKANFSSLHSFKNPNLKIFVLKTDYNQLIKYVTEITDLVVKKEGVPSRVKIKFLNGLIADACKNLDGKGVASLAKLHKVSHMVSDMMKGQANFNEIMSILQELPLAESRHSMCVCMVSLILAEEMDMRHGVALDRLTLGCLLHDVGLRYVPERILKKPRHQWTSEDEAIYEEHPLKGIEMLRDIRELSNDVLIMISEHHENSKGTGFPKKIRDVKISPLGKILILANAFTNLIMPSESGAAHTADAAIEYIDQALGQPFNKQVFQALKNVVNKQYLERKLARTS